MNSTTQQSVEQVLQNSIDSYAAFDFSQWRYPVKLYMDTVSKQIVFHVEDSQPLPHRCGDWVYLMEVKTSAIPETVSYALNRIRKELIALLELMDRCPDKNKVAADFLNEIEQKNIFQYIQAYWEPSDWFESEEDSLKELWLRERLNEDRREAIAEGILSHVDLGDLAKGVCKRKDAIQWLQKKMSEWEDEGEGENEDEYGY